jgi:S-adenosyl-L-methionine hydrolase (adenosine-forming)
MITLLTDFDTADVFVASMKGVILGISPKTTLVDITHEVPPHGIRQAAYLLKSAYGYFPTGTIHVVVVDPGVGGERNPLLIVHPKAYFIGPDNGVFSYIYKEKVKLKVYRLNSLQYRLKKYSSTFDGRDLFSPVAAWLSKGVAPEKLGQRVKDFVSFPIPEPQRLSNNSLQGHVIHTDRFGNLVTNITMEELKPWLATGMIPTITIKRQVIKGLKQFYAQASPGELCALINSDDHLEIFCYQSSAQSLIKTADDEPVIVQ